ncbi:MAG: methyltransferase domain-containing protein [Myxococcota bacterium]
MTHQHIHQDVARYYEAKLAEHGPTHRGVDWNSGESQALRFEQLARILPAEGFSVLDVGCGYGGLRTFLGQRRREFRYVGYDISPQMVASARGLHPDGNTRFTSSWDEVEECDYSVASGIFNVRLEHSDGVWRDYILDTLLQLHQRARVGWAANFLTSYSDPPKRRANLYYADPCFILDWLQRNISRHVALLHDYGLYEFTVLVRRNPGGQP